MKHLFLIITLNLSILTVGVAQEATYHLPKTALRFTMLVEKTTYKPGDLSMYAQRFLKRSDVNQEASETYRLLNVDMQPFGMPDSARVHTALIDQKHNIAKLNMSKDNILLAINANGKEDVMPAPFVSAQKPQPLDPYKYLNQDILAVGSKLKMAELTAKDIYEIRDSRNELTRGQADYMPKDGEQLRIMLQNLDTQEAAMRQLFEGVTTVDTTQVELVYVPEKAVSNQTLFRFSKYAGVVDADDLSGEAYYITVDDLHSMPARINEPGKKVKDETGVWIVLPGKIRVAVATNTKTLLTKELSAAQFGEEENLNEPLFSKKVNTQLVLNPYNGGIDKIESTPIK